MKLHPVSRIYAKALFLNATEKNEVQEVAKSLSELVQFKKENAAFAEALESAAFSHSEKVSLGNEFIKIAGLHPSISRLLELLVVKARAQLIPQISEAFAGFIDESNGLIRGEVHTVEALSDQEKEDLSKAFSKKFNKRVVLNQVIDKSILGGLVVTVQGKMFDGSLKTSIQSLKESLERQTT